MTTPQNQLHMLSERICHLTDLFESDENGYNIFDTIRKLDLQMSDLVASHQRIEELLHLVIKFLAKSEQS